MLGNQPKSPVGKTEINGMARVWGIPDKGYVDSIPVELLTYDDISSACTGA